MARKPNFRFERQERERVHAEKRAARDALKEQRKAELEPQLGADGQPVADGDADGAADGAAAVAGAPAPASAAPAGRPAPPPVELTEAQKGAVNAAMKALETMTPEEVATLHQNATRLASSGSAKQRAAAQELLPRLEAELERLSEAKRQAAAARLAGAAKRSKKQ